MRAGLDLLVAFAAIWTLGAGIAEARCDLTDPTSVAPPSVAAPPREAAAPHAPSGLQAFSTPPRQPIRAVPAHRAEPNGGRSVTPGGRSAIPDTALMRKRRIL